MQSHPQYWILVLRPGLCDVRKGPFTDMKMVEAMLRNLYARDPRWRCSVITATEFDYCAGREWIANFGDRRRKRPPPEPAHSSPDIRAPHSGH
jgi:hypothetical protein